MTDIRSSFFEGPFWSLRPACVSQKTDTSLLLVYSKRFCLTYHQPGQQYSFNDQIVPRWDCWLLKLPWMRRFARDLSRNSRNGWTAVSFQLTPRRKITSAWSEYSKILSRLISFSLLKISFFFGNPLIAVILYTKKRAQNFWVYVVIPYAYYQ